MAFAERNIGQRLLDRGILLAMRERENSFEVIALNCSVFAYEFEYNNSCICRIYMV